jgi:serine/threonine protein phosphatase PrpC
MSHPFGTIQARAVTTFGNAGNRPAQEDFVLADREKGVFVVADGFGGPLPGAAAAKAACEAVKNFLFKEARDQDATLPFVIRTYLSLASNVLFNSLVHANKKLLAMNRNKNVHEKGGASVLAAFLDGNQISIGNIGSCTAKLIRGNQKTDLVTPRTLGRMKDPFSNGSIPGCQVPLMSLGMAEDLEPEIVEYEVRHGDWIVFKTDGIPESLIQQALLIKQKNLSIDQSLREFNEALKQTQFDDNAAVLLVII